MTRRVCVGGWLLLVLSAKGPSAQEPALHREDAHPGCIPIHVHRAGDEHGLAGVAVRVLDSAERLWFPETAPWDLFARMQRHLPSATTDESGTVWVPEPSGGFGVLAQADGWIGFAHSLVLPERVLEVELAPDPTLRVRIVDAGGQPVAGVNAALIATDSRETRMLLEADASGADGSAELHPGRWRGNDSVQRVFAMAANGDPRAELREVERDSTPAQPLTLALGPTGVVEVVLVDGEGKPVAADGITWFDVPDTPRTARLDGLSMLTAVHVEHGRGRFEHAPAGLELALQIGGGGAIANEVEGVQPKPRIESARLESTGQRLELAFEVSHVLPRLHARLLLAPGEPLAEAPVFVRWLQSRATMEREDRVYTDAGGFVSSFAFSEAKLAGDVQVEFSSLDRQLGRSARVTLTLSGPEYHELGDILLTPAPLLASGCVVDERGEPLTRAVVRAYERPKDGLQRSPPERSRRELFAITAPDGRFDLQGTLDGGELLLEASHARAETSGKLAVELGKTDVRLTLARTGAIEVRARFDEGRRANLTFQLMGARGPTTGHESMSEGTYRIADLPPGEYTLRCLWADADSLLVEIPRVVVRPGETTHDPRCDPLDLRGKVP